METTYSPRDLLVLGMRNRGDVIQARLYWIISITEEILISFKEDSLRQRFPDILTLDLPPAVYCL